MLFRTHVRSLEKRVRNVHEQNEQTILGVPKKMFLILMLYFEAVTTIGILGFSVFPDLSFDTLFICFHDLMIKSINLQNMSYLNNLSVISQLLLGPAPICNITLAFPQGLSLICNIGD